MLDTSNKARDAIALLNATGMLILNYCNLVQLQEPVPACLGQKDLLPFLLLFQNNTTQGVPSAESSRSLRGLGKGVSGKPYPRLCNARRPRLEPGTFRSQAVRLYRLHQAHPSHRNIQCNYAIFAEKYKYQKSTGQSCEISVSALVLRLGSVWLG